MTTKIITVAAAGSVPAPSSGADYNKGAPLNAVEFDQNIVNLRNAVDAALAALAGYSAGNASGNIPISNGTVNTNLNADMVGGFHASQTPGANQIPVLNSAATLPVNGVKFPATQVASSDPNTLDDYEEGTFTPILSFGGSSAGITYLEQTGKYVKAGGMFVYTARIRLTSKGTSAGPMSIAGLPFPNMGGLNDVGASVGLFTSFNSSLTSFPIALYVNTALYMAKVISGSMSTFGDADFNNDSQVEISGIGII